MPPIALCLLALLIPLSVNAEGPSVIIDRIEPQGATADDEFIDLLNTGAAEVAIDTWSIQYRSAAGTKYYKKNLPDGALIGPASRYRIAGSGYARAEPPDLQHGSFSLSASGGTVFLVGNRTLLTSSDDPSIIALLRYGPPDDGGTPAPQTPQVPLPIVPVIPVLQLTIRAFQAVPPAGEDEWVEIGNESSYAVELEGWTIADATGKTVAKPTGLLLPGAAMKVTLASARLNNDGDRIALRDPRGREVHVLTYGDEGEGTAAPHASAPPDYESVVAGIMAEIDAALRSVRTDERIVIEQLTVNVALPAPLDAAGSTVARPMPIAAPPKSAATKISAPTVQGTVSVAPGALWKEYFVLDSKEGGIQVHLPKNTALELTPGDELTARGTWSTAQTAPLRRFLVKKDADVSVRGRTEAPEPAHVGFMDIEQQVGRLIEVRAPVVERQSRRIRLAADDRSVVVTVEAGSAMRVGDEVTARGLLTRDGIELKLLPLGPGGMTVSLPPPPPPPPRTRTLLPYAIALTPAGLLSAVAWYGYRKKRKGGDADGRR